ncbi:hypothetical protein PPERSA_13033 [Pseudocohnilembus persalinus]|uniref:Ferrochelatase n=1 Tax=Pseudocohnilembus persalinus TaxID=266149 RepID=A0A0V0R2Z2_PSEPJ|nr:hypothetical protein PPERSA_13033 [Pseudocohnilembus persalinus]|eukprot:KRX08552.1 hypothetical protein PPERSA_13033 [Pseudocohnilembus persalinus]
MLNLGGPESAKDVSPFLERLFADSTVIRIPFGLGKYIGKIRGPAKVQKQYDEIGGGSPIRKWTETQGKLMMENIEKNHPEVIQKYGPFHVVPGFRYSEPLCDETLKNLIQNQKENGLENIVLFSQYPQWSCSTVGNSVREALKVIEKLNFPLENVHIIDRWYRNPKYLEALTNILFEDIKKNFSSEELKESIILFSAHSLPVDFIQQGDPYSLEIGTTANLIMDKLVKKLQEENLIKNNDIPFRVCWQSKVGFNSWLKPNTEEALEFYKSQFKNVILSPLGFVQDHLETLYELDLEYIKSNEKNYKKIIRARSLNDHPEFIEALEQLLVDSLTNKYNLQSYPTKNFQIRCPECFCKNDCAHLTNYFNKTQKQEQL